MVGSLFPTFPVCFTIRVAGPGVGEVDLEGIAKEGVVNLVVAAGVTLFLIVPSDDFRPSSVEKPRSSWENMAAVKSPMESKGSPSFSTCCSAESAECTVDTERFVIELCWGLDMTLNPD